MNWNSAIILFSALAACAVANTSPVKHASPLIDLLTAGNFTAFRDELVKYNLTDIIHSPGLLTVFAPVNDAFQDLQNSTRRFPEWKTMSNEERIRMLRRCVIIGTKLLPLDLKNEMELRPASGEQLRVNVYPGIRMVNGLMLNRNPMLQNHDIIIYRIPQLIRVPMPGNSIYSALTMQSREQQDRFGTLIKLINSAGLKDQLTSGGPLTVFAPINDAFSNYPDKTLLSSMMESTTLQKKLVLSHVMNGTFFLSGLLSIPEQHTLDGGSNRIFLAGPGNVTIGGARILTGEGLPILATNGIIHLIDRVLIR